MLAALFKNWRTRTAEFEAQLMPPPGAIGSGEIEMSVYSDGSSKFEIEIDEIEAPEGSEISVLVAGVEIARGEVENGRHYARLDSTAGRPLPLAAEGDLAEVRWAGEVMLSGVFEID